MVDVCQGVAMTLQRLADATARLAGACDVFADALEKHQLAWRRALNDLVVGGGAGSIDVIGLAVDPPSIQAAHDAATSMTGVAHVSADVSAELVAVSNAPLVDAAVTVVTSVRYAHSPWEHVSNGRLRSGYAPTRLTKTTIVDLNRVPPTLRAEVGRTLARARQGKVAKVGHDNQQYQNRDARLPLGANYTEWTVSLPQDKRGRVRLVIAGDPRHPDAVYFTDDHYRRFIWIGP